MSWLRCSRKQTSSTVETRRVGRNQARWIEPYKFECRHILNPKRHDLWWRSRLSNSDIQKFWLHKILEPKQKISSKKSGENMKHQNVMKDLNKLFWADWKNERSNKSSQSMETQRGGMGAEEKRNSRMNRSKNQNDGPRKRWTKDQVHTCARAHANTRTCACAHTNTHTDWMNEVTERINRRMCRARIKEIRYSVAKRFRQRRTLGQEATFESTNLDTSLKLTGTRRN